MRRLAGILMALAAVLAGCATAGPVGAELMIVGNFLDRDVSILKVEGTTVTDTGKRLQLPGRPASMRGRTP